LKVTYELLTGMATTMTELAGHFRGLEDQGETAVDEVSHWGGLHGALKEFQNDWDTWRLKLIGELESLAEAATAIADGFRCTVEQLAQGLEPGEC
jgi:uncharacterized protein YukE